MPASQISFHPGKPSFVEIRVTTSAPLDWLTLVRHSFMSLLEYYHDPLPPDTACLQGEVIGLLYSLHPLPAQMKAGVMALETPPGANENAGYYFTSGGLAIRLQVPATFEGLDTTLRALLAVGQHSGCRLSDEIRAGYFELLGALIPSLADVNPFPASQIRFVSFQTFVRIVYYTFVQNSDKCITFALPSLHELRLHVVEG